MAMILKSKKLAAIHKLQFPGGTATFYVRNTFIDFDDASPTLASMRRDHRCQTLPAVLKGPVIENLEFEGLDVKSSSGESTTESHDSINFSSTSTKGSFPPSPSFAPPVPSMSVRSVMVPTPTPAPRGQTLEWTCEANGSFHVCWKVDARKLRGNDKQAVSPAFELPIGPGDQTMKLRIVIYPKDPELKGAVNFRNSKGKGYIQVKCESEIVCQSAPLCLTMSVGAGRQAQPARGSITHDFARNGICGLPRREDTWDFSAAIESNSLTFPIFLGASSLAGNV